MKKYIKSSSGSMDDIIQLADDVEALLNENRISHVELYNYKRYEPIPEIAVISFLIEGDWKHDHIRADWLVKDNFSVVKNESYATEDTGSDWGPEVHTYYIYMNH